MGKITEKEVAQELLGTAHALITQPVEQSDGTKLESLRRVPLSMLFSKIHSESILCVRVTQNDDRTYAADKTYLELREAHNAGKTLLCHCCEDDICLPLTGMHNTLIFSAVVGGYVYQVVIREDAENPTLSKTALGEGGQGGTAHTLVTVTDSDAGLSADKSCKEILEAHQAGLSVRCTFMAFSLPLVRAAAAACTFTGVFNSQVYTITISADGAVTVTNEPFSTGEADAHDFPTLLPRKQWVDPTEHSTIAEVRFAENYNPIDFDASWDAGVEPGSITAYREGNVLTVSANGKRKIKINAESAALFNCFHELRAIKGLEMLDASDATTFGGMFVQCYKLTDVDLSTWHCDKVTSIGGMFQDCYELRTVKMPHGLSRDTLTVTAQTFEECHKLREVDMGPGPKVIGDRMFAKCVNLERVTGLKATTSIGTKTFIYCANLKDIDLDPAILTNIGESAFRLSSVEDCINLDDLNTACVVGDYATRAKRWSDNAMLTAIRTKDIPTVFLSVPHADSQLKYTDVKFAYKDGPWDEDADPDDVSIALGGCSALSLYHEWQCIHKGTELEKANFLDYWKDFEGDKFADINTEENMPVHFRPQAAMLGWGHEETYITSDAQYDVIIDRLNKHLPTCVIMHSTNIDGYHAVVIIGADTLSRKLAVLDSAVTAEGAALSWVKFEDIFTDAADGDRLVVHTFGEGFDGYEPPEYIPVPTQATVGQVMAVKSVDAGRPTAWEPVDMSIGGATQDDIQRAVDAYMAENPVEVQAGIPVPTTASVGQTIVVKSVDETGKPTEWEAADMASGGGGGDTLKFIKTITLAEEVAAVKINTDADGNPLNLKRIVVAVRTIGGTPNTDKSNVFFYPNSVNQGAIRYTLSNGVYATAASVSSVVDIQMITKGVYLDKYSCNSTVKETWGSYGVEETIKEINFLVSNEGYTFGVGTVFHVMGVEA